MGQVPEQEAPSQSPAGESSRDDIVLITIDCFRHDAPDVMPNLRSLMEGEGTVRTEAIAPSCSTPWVSPALMQSRVFPDVLYDARGPDREAHTRYSVDDSVPSLPRALSAAGYSTAAFIAANPYLRQYTNHFDMFWDGFDPSAYESPIGPVAKWSSRLSRTLLLKKEVPGEELIRRSREWYTSTDAPRFLWMHFMEPHFPYYPGLRRGRDVGLLDAYRATFRKFRSDDRANAIPDRDERTIRELYWQCIRRVDEYLPEAVAFLEDDAIVALTGDHGEAFEHGWIGHVDVYDETVRVPLVFRNLPESGYDGRTVRQLDIPPTLLNAVGIDPPDEWEGILIGENRPLEALLAMAGPRQGQTVFTVGLRTDDEKLIRRYDFEEEAYVESERYDMTVDPGEMENRYDPDRPSRIEARLDRVVKKKDLLDKARTV